MIGESYARGDETMKEAPKIGNNRKLFTNRDLWRLIGPLLVEQLLVVAVGMADTIMVAYVGEDAVSAVSLVDTVNILLINIFAALATGGAVVAGQYLGKKKPEYAARAGEQLFVFITMLSIIIMALLYAGRYFLLHIVFGKITPEVMGYANTYLLIVSASIPFLAIYNSGAALFRAMGDAKVSMRISFVMNCLNIGGNAIMVYGLKAGVEGVAIPTLISRVVAAVAITLLLRNQDLSIHISKPFSYKFDKDLVWKILHIGIPNGVENSMFQLGKILLLSLVATFGTASIAANAVSNSVACFQTLPGMAIGYAVVTVVSRCVGAGDYQQVRYYTRKLFVITYIAMIITNIGILIALPWILSFYRLAANTEHMALQILTMYAICSAILWPSAFTLPNTLRAANDVRYAMFVSVGSMWICRIAAAYVLGSYLHMGLMGVWGAMILDWCVRILFFVIRYRGKRWETMKL